jgi:hypothetical protein
MRGPPGRGGTGRHDSNPAKGAGSRPWPRRRRRFAAEGPGWIEPGPSARRMDQSRMKGSLSRMETIWPLPLRRAAV